MGKVFELVQLRVLCIFDPLSPGAKIYLGSTQGSVSDQRFDLTL
jgi:hypothetical protein